MALQVVYRQFLTAPNSAALAADASLHYITTTTSYSGANEIIKHLNTQRNQVKKKKEDILSVVEGADAIAVELETTLEFITGGGSYLPGLDDNFLTDRTITLPIIHIVKFNGENKITQIRQNWDQGALLKQLDVIGRTGRNWPIRDSKEQAALVTRCAKAAGTWVAPADAVEEVVVVRSRGNSTNAMRDPHASLSLFAPREEVDALPSSVMSPYAGNRPRQRDFVEILGDHPVDEAGGDSAERPQSPTKPKAGSGKHFQPVRLFDQDENTDRGVGETSEKGQAAAKRLVRPDPTKYQHFDFSDGSDLQEVPKPAGQKPPRSRHDSNWSFDDFVTPQKPIATRAATHRARERQWGAEDDEKVDKAKEALPARKVQQVKGRRDAEKHFELQDDGPPVEEPRLIGRPRGTAHNTGLGLYQNNLYDEEGSAAQASAAPAPILGNITNLKDRRKDFDAHFTMADQSPSQGASGDAAAGAGAGAGAGPAKVSDDRMKAVRMMESNWDSYDQSPSAQKENSNPNGGGGGGGDNGQNRRTGDDRGINTAGDGMGGKKGTSRDWGFGDESDGEQNVHAAVPGKKPGAMPKAGSNFWEF